MDGGDEDSGDDMDGNGKEKEKVVLMWGYLPGVSLQRSPLLLPTVVALPECLRGDSWEDIHGGGCGFAVATTESGKLITWGSADDLGQSYLTSGKHEETPEAFPLPTEDRVVKAAAGWAHCTTVTDQGEVYAWGWKECVPTNKSTVDQSFGATMEKSGVVENGSQSEQATESPKYQVSKSNSTAVVSGCEKKAGENNKKRRRVSVAKQAPEGPASDENEEASSAVPCLVMLGAGVRITAVAAGGRHTLALSDAGHVWGWGYGGEGQLGLGTRIRTVSSPQPVPCLEPPHQGKDELPKKDAVHCGGQANRVYGNCVKAIACGGRHSVAVTDTGALLTFGWGLHGQCGQGGTDDELSPTCVSSLLGIQIQGIAAGLWHTVCTSVEGDVYAFGGNQFGQLGTGSDHVETLPKLVEARSLENKNAKAVSCGARHSAVITEEGSVFCWGWNKYGQLGLGDATDRSTPSEVQIDGYQPKNVSCGWWHTLVMAEPST